MHIHRSVRLPFIDQLITEWITGRSFHDVSFSFFISERNCRHLITNRIEKQQKIARNQEETGQVQSIQLESKREATVYGVYCILRMADPEVRGAGDYDVIASPITRNKCKGRFFFNYRGFFFSAGNVFLEFCKFSFNRFRFFKQELLLLFILNSEVQSCSFLLLKV